MAEIRDSAFKVQPEVVESHFGIPPERGAILFLASDHQLIYGDGYNWLDLGPGADVKAAVALELQTGYSIPFVAGVEQQVTFYDVEIYNYLTKFNPSGGDQITISAAFDIDYYAEYCLSSSVQNTLLTITQKYNSHEVAREIKLVQNNKRHKIQGFGIFTAAPADVWTVWAKTDKNCTMTVCDVKLGMHERT